jgi:hypothetical protein
MRGVAARARMVREHHGMARRLAHRGAEAKSRQLVPQPARGLATILCVRGIRADAGNAQPREQALPGRVEVAVDPT